MTKIQAMRSALSTEALAVLSLAGSDKIGFVVQSGNESVMTELRKVGVIGERDGLTILGSGLAGRLQEEALNALF